MDPIVMMHHDSLSPKTEVEDNIGLANPGVYELLLLRKIVGNTEQRLGYRGTIYSL